MDAEGAISHIINSLENTNSDLWTDMVTDETWYVYGNKTHLFVEITDADDNETTYMFRLVKEQ